MVDFKKFIDAVRSPAITGGGAVDQYATVQDDALHLENLYAQLAASGLERVDILSFHVLENLVQGSISRRGLE